MKKILLITKDEEYTDKNKELFEESLAFVKTLASIPNYSYSQMANFKYKDGLLKRMIATYIDSSNFSKNANLVFDTPTNIPLFNNIFPKNTNEEFYRDVFAARNGISVSTIRKMPQKESYHSRINSLYFFGTTAELLCNNFDYIILHHGGSDIIYYLSTLNRELYSDLSETRNIEKIFLINKNNRFNKLIEQFKSLEESDIEEDILHPSICLQDSLTNIHSLLSQDRVYRPKVNKKLHFTID